MLIIHRAKDYSNKIINEVKGCSCDCKDGKVMALSRETVVLGRMSVDLMKFIP